MSFDKEFKEFLREIELIKKEYNDEVMRCDIDYDVSDGSGTIKIKCRAKEV